MKTEIDLDRLDDVTLRLSCANSLLTVLQCVAGSPETCDQPSRGVMVESLHGIGMLIADAHCLLSA